MAEVLSSIDIARVHVFISGQVQGVFFRKTAQDVAEELGLRGWVRNTHDGRVEAVFEGTKAQLREVINWCHEGPPQAYVKHVAIAYEPPEGLADFKIVR